jgi:hypothetical protein
MTTRRRKPHRHPAHEAIDHIAELKREKAAILSILADSLKPSQDGPDAAPVATATMEKRRGHGPGNRTGPRLAGIALV